MLTEFIRVFTREGATLTDKSIDNSEKSGIAITNQDSIYIAQKYPFNNFFMLFDELSIASEIFTIEFWDGDNWIEAVDKLDFTKGFTRNGVVQFSMPREHDWYKVNYTDEPETNVPPECVGTNVNHCYWLRLVLDGAAAFTVKKITYGFTTSEKINSIEKNGAKFYETFAAGKNDWVDEIIEASEMMVSELKQAGQIKGPGQINAIDEFVLPCAYRTLIHIYENMGKGYDDKKSTVALAYAHFLSGPKQLDSNMNARIDEQETMTRLFR